MGGIASGMKKRWTGREGNPARASANRRFSSEYKDPDFLQIRVGTHVSQMSRRRVNSPKNSASFLPGKYDKSRQKESSLSCLSADRIELAMSVISCGSLKRQSPNLPMREKRTASNLSGFSCLTVVVSQTRLPNC
jgi:hypothetical protein